MDVFFHCLFIVFILPAVHGEIPASFHYAMRHQIRTFRSVDNMFRIYIPYIAELRFPYFFSAVLLDDNSINNPGNLSIVWSFETENDQLKWIAEPGFMDRPSDQNDLIQFNEETNNLISDIGNSEWIQKRISNASHGCILESGNLITSSLYKCQGQIIGRSFSRAGRYRVRISYNYLDAKGMNLKRFSYIQFKVINNNKEYRSRKVVRKEFRALNKSDWKRFVNVLFLLKRIGVYDMLVAIHRTSMYRMYDLKMENVNISHGVPSFLPWHRLYVLILEKLVQLYGNWKDFGMPFWDWTIDRELKGGPSHSPLWTDEYAGPTGDFFTGVVQSGNFCSKRSIICKGYWPIRKDLDGPELRRQVGYRYPLVPSQQQIAEISSESAYDILPMKIQLLRQTNQLTTPAIWVNSTGFRPALEGLTAVGHNSVHLFIGGSMIEKTSPNDPVFFLHHSYTDWIYYKWQIRRKCYHNCWTETVVGSRTMPGQKWQDTLWPFDITIEQVASYQAVADLPYKFAVS